MIFLAQVKKDERHKMFNPIEASEKAPLLEKANLLGAGYYIEYKTDDARLTIEVLKKGVELGTIASNYMKVIDLIYDSGKITGVVVQDGLTNASFPVYAKKSSMLQVLGSIRCEKLMDQKRKNRSISQKVSISFLSNHVFR